MKKIFCMINKRIIIYFFFEQGYEWQTGQYQDQKASDFNMA